jgi:hypothetical protein
MEHRIETIDWPKGHGDRIVGEIFFGRRRKRTQKSFVGLQGSRPDGCRHMDLF